ncbi:hypothetical protein AXK11_02970 [Cephaloticoccus primus]|uniref:Uncharacterized protein n=1 Tax=Cephaloticoccus primus TaxID=1548207 RepID=A0A139SRA9_9BACT|nr:hypothetical protein AXK11_02970 [Cephaloticoccus primus]
MLGRAGKRPPAIGRPQQGVIGQPPLRLGPALCDREKIGGSIEAKRVELPELNAVAPFGRVLEFQGHALVRLFLGNEVKAAQRIKVGRIVPEQGNRPRAHVEDQAGATPHQPLNAWGIGITIEVTRSIRRRIGRCGRDLSAIASSRFLPGNCPAHQAANANGKSQRSKVLQL